MDCMEDLVINASMTEDIEGSEKSFSGFPWPFSNLMGDSSRNSNGNSNGYSTITTTKRPEARSAATASIRKGSRRLSLSGSRNHKAQVKESPSTGSSSNNTTKPIIVPLVDDKFVVDRFRHDVEQAKLMRREMDRRRQQKEQQQKEQRQQQQQRTRNEHLTEEHIRLALEGLDEAVVLRQKGRTREALDISELSIEMLIGYLKRCPAELDVQGVSRDAVGNRIQNALTLAEEMKSELRGNEQSSKPSTKGGNRNSTTTTQRQQLQSRRNKLSRAVEALSELLNETKPVSPTEKPTRKAKSKTITRMPSKSTDVNITRTDMPGKTNTYGAKSRTANTKRQTAVGRPSLFANSQEPLVNTIKSELYIDPSKLHNTTWKDIAGLEHAKQALQEAAILPLMRPDLFSGLRKPRNILLYGPPGTGKTLLVKAVAHESSTVLFVCTASAMTSKWHGEGEKLLRTLFQVARDAAPSIVFVDEVDSLLSSRKSDGEHEASRRFKTEFMTNIDGIVKTGGDENGKHLLVIAATNCPWDIDSAVLRRFPRRIYIPLPDSTTRKALLKNLLEKAGDTELSSDDIKRIVKRLEGFSGSDISSIASEASFGPIRSLGDISAIQSAKSVDIRPIQRKDFDQAIEQATKSVSKLLLKQYDQWKDEQAAS